MLSFYDVIKDGQLRGRQPDGDDLHGFSTSPRPPATASLEHPRVVTCFGLGNPRLDHLFRNLVPAHANNVNENYPDRVAALPCTTAGHPGHGWETQGMSRHEALTRLAEHLCAVAPERPALVAIDGFDGAGKTVLAQELVALVSARGTRPVVNVSMDDFHHPRAHRYATGRGPESFYRASYDYEAFRRCVVTPLRAGRAITPAVWDVDEDRPVWVRPIDTAPDTMVLVDGIFLHRPELCDEWNASVWVDVPFSVSVPRGNARFPGEHDPNPEAEEHYRYVAGQRLYLAEASPREAATFIFENTNLDCPRLFRGAEEVA